MTRDNTCCQFALGQKLRLCCRKEAGIVKSGLRNQNKKVFLVMLFVSMTDLHDYPPICVWVRVSLTPRCTIQARMRMYKHIRMSKWSQGIFITLHTHSSYTCWPFITNWHEDSSTIFLKPQYKFNYISSTNKEVCTLSQDFAKVHTRGTTSYNHYFLDYGPQTMPNCQ